MKPISLEVSASVSSEGMGEITTRFQDKIAYLIVDNNEYEIEGELLEPKGDLCGFCRREKGERDLIIAGHTVSICSECFASLNTPDLVPSVCGQC